MGPDCYNSADIASKVAEDAWAASIVHEYYLSNTPNQGWSQLNVPQLRHIVETFVSLQERSPNLFEACIGDLLFALHHLVHRGDDNIQLTAVLLYASKGLGTRLSFRSTDLRLLSWKANIAAVLAVNAHVELRMLEEKRSALVETHQDDSNLEAELSKADSALRQYQTMAHQTFEILQELVQKTGSTSLQKARHLQYAIQPPAPAGFHQLLSYTLCMNQSQQFHEGEERGDRTQQRDAFWPWVAERNKSVELYGKLA